jgi:MFS family permease
MSFQTLRADQRIATRLIFGLGGIVLGAWAPLVPLAKFRLAIDEGALGMLLLCMGLGSILAMPVTAALTARFGCRQIISGAGVGLCLVLPLLAVLDNMVLMAAALLAFGVVMGCMSVSMNLQAVIVERNAKTALMSGFHAMFSLGGIVGSGSMALLLAIGVQPLVAAAIVSLVMVGILITARPGLLPYSGDDEAKGPAFVFPQGVVIAIGFLSLLAMLAEGGVLDWGALFMIETHDAALGQAGFAYTAFAITMTLGRLFGDKIRTRYGDVTILVVSASLATLGFLVALLVPSGTSALLGFLLVGAGISNIAPILFTLTGKTKRMPANLAVASVLTVGYVGIIAGPAGIGLIAHATNIQTAFFLLCGAMVVIAVSARAVVKRI